MNHSDSNANYFWDDILPISDLYLERETEDQASDELDQEIEKRTILKKNIK